MLFVHQYTTHLLICSRNCTIITEVFVIIVIIAQNLTAGSDVCTCGLTLCNITSVRDVSYGYTLNKVTKILWSKRSKTAVYHWIGIATSSTLPLLKLLKEALHSIHLLTL